MKSPERLREQEKRYAEMTDSERKVYETIGDTLLDGDYPEDYFRKASLEEINKRFGRHCDMVVTERVRQSLAFLLDEAEWFHGAMEVWDDLPEED